MTTRQRKEYREQLIECINKFSQSEIFHNGIEVNLPTSRGMMHSVKWVGTSPYFVYHQNGLTHSFKWDTFDITTIRQVINKLNNILQHTKDC